MTAINPAPSGLRQHAGPTLSSRDNLAPQALSIPRALTFLTEAALLTLTAMANKRSRTPLDYSRHISICQVALHWARLQREHPRMSPALTCLLAPGASLEAWLQPQETAAGPSIAEPSIAKLSRSGFGIGVASDTKAVAYLTSCSLATIEDLCLRTNPPVRELVRQCSLAQVGLDACIAAGELSDIRVNEILAAGLSVAQWAKKMRNRP